MTERASGLSRWALSISAGAIFVFLMLPLAIVFPISFSSSPYLQFPPPGYSLQWYARFFSDQSWIDAAWRSIYIGLLCTIISIGVGVPLAFAMIRSRRWVGLSLDKLAMAPMVVPVIIYSIAVYGIFARLQLIGSGPAIALAHAVLAMPYVVILVGAALKEFDETQERAAEGLGASWLTTLWRITLPQIRPSILSAALLSFISSFDELVVSMFLAGPYMTLPKKMYDNIVIDVDPTIAAVAVIQIILVAACLLIIFIKNRSAAVIMK